MEAVNLLMQLFSMLTSFEDFSENVSHDSNCFYITNRFKGANWFATLIFFF